MRVFSRWGLPWFTFDRRPKAGRPDGAAREERIRDLMRLALGTAAGQCHPDRQQLLGLLRQESSPGTLAARFPVVQRDEYLRGRNRHLNIQSRDPGFRRFEYVLAPSTRTAILMEGFVENASVMCFPEGWDAEMAYLRPECLAGPVTTLRRMAACVLNRGAYFPSVRRPIVAFTGLPFGDAGVLTNADRDLLWKAFGVPVLEYFLGHRHEVLARECDVRMGLHINLAQTLFEVIESARTRQAELVVTSLANTHFPVVRLASGLGGTLIGSEPCPCGFTGPRLLDIHSLAATAPKTRVRVAMPAAARAFRPTLADA